MKLDESQSLDDEFDAKNYKIHLAVRANRSSSTASSCVTFQIGEPLTVYWAAPETHSPKDWVGLYKVTANPSKSVTTVSSAGRWIYLDNEGQRAGQCVFSGDRVPWETGVYEFRLHFNDKHIVAARSSIFEIKCKCN